MDCPSDSLAELAFVRDRLGLMGRVWLTSR